MPNETPVTLIFDARSLYNALRLQRGDWVLADHEFDMTSDEVKVSVDPGGSARVALTVNFELDAAEFKQLLERAEPVR
jgi:hypothetical protein